MFFEGDRIDAMREMILADNLADRKKRWRSCSRISATTSRDLQGAQGLSGDDPFPRSAVARVRPARRKGAGSDLAEKLGVSVEKIMPSALHVARVQPDARSSRLPPRHRIRKSPEMQARAVLEAAADANEEDQGEAGSHDPARRLQEGTRPPGRDRSSKSPRKCMKEKKVKIAYMVGTMIEVPRGALTADEIAQTAEFFSFGTNDLTQTALGMSPRRHGLVPHAVHRKRNLQEEPVRLDRPGWRRPAHADRGEKGNKPPVRASSSASAANTAATLTPSSSAIASA
jgi:pyruvate,orthophosphate dikinase